MLIVEGLWLYKEMCCCMSVVGWRFLEKEDDRIAEDIITYRKKTLLATSLRVKLWEFELIKEVKMTANPPF